MSGKTDDSSRVTLRLPRATAEKLQAMATAASEEVSAIVEKALRAEFAAPMDKRLRDQVDIDGIMTPTANLTAILDLLECASTRAEEFREGTLQNACYLMLDMVDKIEAAARFPKAEDPE